MNPACAAHTLLMSNVPLSRSRSRSRSSSKTIHDRNWSARETPRRMDEPLRGGFVGGWA